MPEVALPKAPAASGGSVAGLLRAELLLPALSMALLYAPTVRTLATGLWQSEDHAYSPFILAVAGWLAWRRWREGLHIGGAGLPFLFLLLAGLIIHLCGRLLGNISVETASVLFVLPGLLGWIGGWRRLVDLAYPLLALPFVVPLPGSLIVALTFPLKMAVSKIAAFALHLAGMPVARQGILIEVGNYRLLVADACSGLQSMYSLAASAVVYLALARHRSPLRVGLILLAVVPIAFAANVARVVILALITYYLGDAAGQGFLHGFAGIVMFLIAFGGLMLFDRMLGLIGFGREKAA
ncbi:exosortase B [Sphingomonas oleivorans]|uniref:Exosortase B n=1 Tax=Sphingomonas oleivorans TaxID=1735121 RepID=A0A2T5G076_9SPHN|nr:exosortase [Sphingomonas oleivorans]PTQ12345.1 exosortase B [Sphingomonas oleivorans]